VIWYVIWSPEDSAWLRPFGCGERCSPFLENAGRWTEDKARNVVHRVPGLVAVIDPSSMDNFDADDLAGKPAVIAAVPARVRR
jgi:hypothetical protein